MQKQLVLFMKKMENIIKKNTLRFFCLNNVFFFSSDTQMQLSISKFLPNFVQMQHHDVAHLQEICHHYQRLVMNDWNRCHQIGHSMLFYFFLIFGSIVL